MSNRSLDPETDELYAALERFVDARLQRMVIAPTSSEYTSKDLPPGMSRRTFRDHCKRLAARQDGRVCRRGQMWVATREAIDAKPVRARAKSVADPWTPESALRSIGRRQLEETRDKKRTPEKDGEAT